MTELVACRLEWVGSALRLTQPTLIWGSPAKVAEDLLAFREEVGDFGTLLYAGKDWLDRDLGRRSMVLMAEQVLPAVNAAIGA
jgi:hypothetical protein